MEKRPTVEEYCAANNTTVVERQPASMVPPSYRGKPAEEQIRSGVKDIDEILFENGQTFFADRTCNVLFPSPQSVSNHSRVHKEKKEKKAEPAKKVEPEKKVVSRRRTLQKANTDEPSYAHLKEEIKKRDLAINVLRLAKDELATRLGERNQEIQALKEQVQECNNPQHWELVGNTQQDKPVLRCPDDASLYVGEAL
jgi:hypothetical protein